MSKDKTWSGRFNEPVSELVKKYTGSIDFDKRLAEWDIQGSLAHAQMLVQSGVLSEEDLAAIRQGMAEIIAEIKDGTSLAYDSSGKFINESNIIAVQT